MESIVERIVLGAVFAVGGLGGRFFLALRRVA
jgi:hypothetical protein